MFTLSYTLHQVLVSRLNRWWAIKKIQIVWLFIIIATSPFAAQLPIIELSTYEHNPYIGQHLAGKGAIHEIVEQAFDASGYRIESKFYPFVRAMKLTKAGSSVAVFPISYDGELEADMYFSDPLPGERLGMLHKKTSIQATYEPRGKYIGVLRGRFSDFNRMDIKTAGAKFYQVSSNEDLLKMLYVGRVDYVLIDKFTAADLMVDKLPYMIGKLDFVKDTIKPVNFYVGFSKKNTSSKALVAAFNQGLKKITVNGTLNNILYKHGLLSFKPSHSKKVLRIATVANPDMLTMKNLSRQYEQEHPDIVLDWRVLDETVLRKRLLSDLAVSDGQFDVMTIGAFEAQFWARDHWLIPLVKLPQNYDQADLIKQVRQSLSHNGDIYGLPFYAESSMTYYRKDLFKQAGITMPANPTWRQIRLYAAIIHNPKAKIYGICLRGKAGWGENMAVINTIVNAFGASWFDKNWQAQLNSRQWFDAISFYIGLLQNYGPPNPDKNGYSEISQLTADGHCGITIDATVASSLLFDPDKSKVSILIGYASAPTTVTSIGGGWLWVWALAIPSSSTLKDDALEFITWATSKNYIDKVAQSNGWMAVPPGTRYSTYQNDNYRFAAPFSSFVLAAIENSAPKGETPRSAPYLGSNLVAIPEFPALGTEVGKNISLVLARKKTLSNALRSSQSFVAKKMRLAGYGN